MNIVASTQRTFGLLFRERQHKQTDLYLVLAAGIILAITAYLASGPIPSWEISLFRSVNNLPDWLYPIIWPFMQYGVFVTIPTVSAVAWYFKKYRLAVMMLLGGIGIYFLALVVKNLVDRGRPGDILVDPIIARESFRAASLGFTSGHTAVAATIATFAHRYLSSRWQIFSWLTIAIVAFGRVYIGGHLLLDVVGGIALGMAVASLLNYLVGVPKHAEHPLQPVIKLIRVHRPRHPGDIVRLVAGATFFLITTFLAWGQHLSQLEEAVFRVVNYLPSFLSPLVQLIMQAGALWFVPIAAVLALLFKHPRLALKASIGGPLVWILAKIAKELVQRDRPFYILSGIVERASNSGILGFPSGHASVAALLATVASPYVSKNWSRTFWTMAWVVALSRVYVGAHLPLDIIAGLSMGWVFGSTLNLIFGTPGKGVPTRAVRNVLKEAGFRANKLIDAHVDARGSSPMLLETDRGRKLFVKVIDNEHRNADFLYKAWRYFSMREVEDEAPFSTAKHLVEHEAYLYGQAAAAGARVPKVLLASPITPKAAILVTERIDGVTLDRFEHKLSNELLTSIWSQVQKLHQAKIAHRDLRAANVFIDKENNPWLIDFSFATQAADERRLTLDIVEMLVSLSLYADTVQVIKTAVKILGLNRVRAAYPFIQPAALTSVTRRQIKKRTDLLEQIRNEVYKQANARDESPARIIRFNTQMLTWLVLGGLLVYFVAINFDDLSDYASTVNNIHPGWMIGVAAASIATYFASAFVILGASRQPLPYGSSLILQLATSFVNRITPKSLGGVAITERYLENKGLSRTAAISTVSLTYLAGLIVHLLLLGVVAIGFAQHPVSVDLPEGWSLVVIIIVGLILFGISYASKAKKKLSRYAKEAIKSIRHGFTAPVKAGQLFGGSAALTLFYSLALYFSIEAFGANMPYVEVLFVYLAGSALASAAPTPGGLGAIEAALAGGLITFGVNTADAVTGVLLFRLFTYWLPIIPGIFAFRKMQRENLL